MLNGANLRLYAAVLEANTKCLPSPYPTIALAPNFIEWGQICHLPPWQKNEETSSKIVAFCYGVIYNIPGGAGGNMVTFFKSKSSAEKAVKSVYFVTSDDKQ